MQHGEQRRHLFISRVGVPVGRALYPVPVDVALRVHIAQPRHFGMLLVAITDKRMNARSAEPASEGGDVAGAEVLVAEHQHWMLGKRLLDPVESWIIEFR